MFHKRTGMLFASLLKLTSSRNEVRKIQRVELNSQLTTSEDRNHLCIIEKNRRDAETNQECGRIELYRLTHFSESKGWINSIAEKNYEDLLALKAQPVAEGSNEMTEDAICDIVLGKRPGYTRGLGNGILPPSFSASIGYHTEIEELKKRAETADLQNQETARLNEDLASQVKDSNFQIERLMAFQARMEAFMSQFSVASS